MFEYAGDTSGEFNFKSDSDEVKLSPTLHLLASKTDIVKNQYSAFAGADLNQMLRKGRVERVAICGFMTNFWCESTARDAHDNDYFVDFVTDATGTPRTENMDQDRIREVAAELIRAGFARVWATGDYLESRKSKPARQG